MLTLGLNHSIDSGAAIVRDGVILAAAIEERFDRVKHSSAFPAQAMDYCLRAAGATLADVDQAAFFWNPGIHMQAFQAHRAGNWRHHSEFLTTLPWWMIRAWPGEAGGRQVEGMAQEIRFEGAKRPLRIEYLTHHHCHLAAAFYPSPYDSAAILTVDGYGERASAVMARGRGAKIEISGQVEFPHSLGAVYAAVTQYLGFKPNCDEGKVMGLAPYGEPEFIHVFRSWVKPLEDGGFAVDPTPFHFGLERPVRYSPLFEQALGPPRQPGEPLNDRHRAVAASVQLVLEETLIHLIRSLRQRTGEDALCLAGGVALNCVANGKAADALGMDRIFVQPAAGDSGSALGAALWTQHAMHGLPRGAPMRTDALGPSWSNGEIESLLRAAGARHSRPANLEEMVAERITAGAIVGWSQGRAEYGPRALGQRSILADPRGGGMKDRLNSRVKHRESFRPFAPSVLAEHAREVFDFRGDSPFMLRAHPVRPEWRARVPAITHVDGTARIQTVSREASPRYHALISAFHRLTGVPLLVNTSFNVQGQPMVLSPREALECFFTTGIDVLVLEDFVLEKAA
ncbi:MAG: Decarbamoylnovobiocin carbamoyltransferase [Myxococcota bacterium]|nr:Decarbamoylnovobiocin carbamoyltransferase [Myxococcota bacterium]